MDMYTLILRVMSQEQTLPYYLHKLLSSS